jgi:hypothetical protein
MNLVAHVSHQETDDQVKNDLSAAHLKLAGFKPVVTGLHGEELYKSIREQIQQFLRNMQIGFEFKVI